MSKHLNHLCTWLAGAALVCTPMAGALAQAQPTSALVIDPTTGVPVGPSVEFNETTRKTRINVDFGGVPLDTLVESLRASFPEVNFVVAGRLNEQVEPITLKLRSAGLLDILTAINIVTEGRVGFAVRTPTLVALISTRPAPAPPPPAPEGGPGVRIPRVYQVMNVHDLFPVKDGHMAETRLRRLLDEARKITDETLATLHEQDDKDFRAALQPQFNLHEGSGVLVLIGPQESLRVATEVLRSLRVREPEGARTNQLDNPAKPAEIPKTAPPGQANQNAKGPEGAK